MFPRGSNKFAKLSEKRVQTVPKRPTASCQKDYNYDYDFDSVYDFDSDYDFDYSYDKGYDHYYDC